MHFNFLPLKLFSYIKEMLILSMIVFVRRSKCLYVCPIICFSNFMIFLFCQWLGSYGQFVLGSSMHNIFRCLVRRNNTKLIALSLVVCSHNINENRHKKSSRKDKRISKKKKRKSIEASLGFCHRNKTIIANAVVS